MSTRHDIQQAINSVSRSGFVVEIKRNDIDQTTVVSVWRGKYRYNKMFPEVFLQDSRTSYEEIIVSAIFECADRVAQEEQGMKPTPFEMDAGRNRITELERELEKYKTVVKQLSFDLEMSNTNPNAAANVKAIRKAALDQAADYVMDYGIPKDGRDLEELCKKISKLTETRKMAVERGVRAMEAMF